MVEFNLYHILGSREEMFCPRGDRNRELVFILLRYIRNISSPYW